MENLSKFVGDDLGGVPYARDRLAEFARRDVPRAELIARVEGVRAIVLDTLERLAAPHPRPLNGPLADMTSGQFLLHLYGHLNWHLNWHLGRVNDHGRLLAAPSDLA